MRKKKTLNFDDIVIGLDLAIARFKDIVNQQIRSNNFAAAYENNQSVYDLQRVKEYVVEQQEIIKKYHKADMFLHTHGWRWDE